MEARFVPQRYEPNYAYPLLVLFHARGGDEQQMVRSMPALSWRNYVGLSLRGPEMLSKRGRPEGFGWGTGLRPSRPESTPFRPVPRGGRAIPAAALRDRSPTRSMRSKTASSPRSARRRRTLHVHSERIFLVGCGEGAAVAYRIALSYPERFAGVVAINGWLPGSFRPLARLKDCRDLRILVVHGEWNARVPVASARRNVAMLRAGGLRVAFQTYPCAHRLTSPMLSDVDTWLINRCTSEL